MGLEDTSIQDDFKHIKQERARIVREVKVLTENANALLASKVLAHFNNYVDTRVRPFIEGGFIVEPATKAHYDFIAGGFEIEMGDIKHVGPNAYIRKWIGNRASDAVYGYRATAPWVSRVVTQLDAPK